MKITDNFDSIELRDPIFKDVKYFISGKIPDKAITLLNDGGGRQTSYLSDIVTHCVTGDDFEESDVSEAKDIFEIQAVTWKWVILSSRCNTLLPIKGFLAEKGQLFSGVVACVSQLNNTDNCSIWGMVTYYGGELRTRLDPSCTHLITAKPSGAKYEKALKEKEKHGGRNIIEIVTPDWVSDSVKGGVKCEEVLYHPGLLLLEDDKKDEENTIDPLASSLANITGFAEPENQAKPDVSTPQATPTANLLPEQRYERLMEMLEQRKQQESQQLTPQQQQLRNLQIQQQQQMLQQQKLLAQQQQNLINNQFSGQQQQQNLIQQQNLQQGQPILQQQVQQGAQLAQQQQMQQQQQGAGMAQSGMLQQQQQQIQGQNVVPQQLQPQQLQQQQRLQLLQQQQFQQRLAQQQQQQQQQQGGVPGQEGAPVGRVLLTQQQLQQRALQQQQVQQQGGPWRQRVIITEGGKQYVQVVQEANPQQQGQVVQGQQIQVQQGQQIQVQQGQQIQVQQGQQIQVQQGQQIQVQQGQQIQVQQGQQIQGQQVPQQAGQQQQVTGTAPGGGQPQQYTVTIQREAGAQQQMNWQQQQFHLQQQQQLQQKQQQLLQLNAGAPNATPVQGQQGTVVQPQQGPPQLQQRLVWQTTAQGQPVQRQYIHLDSQTHAQLQQLDPQQRALFLQKLQKRQQLLLLQQQQARLTQQANAAGLTPQQQQQQQRQQLTSQQHVAVIRQQLQQQRLPLTPQQQLQWQQQREAAQQAQAQAQAQAAQAGGQQQARTVVIQQSQDPQQQQQQQLLLQNAGGAMGPRPSLVSQQQMVGATPGTPTTPQPSPQVGQQWSGTPPSTPGTPVPQVGQPPVQQQQGVQQGVVATPQQQIVLADPAQRQQLIQLQRQRQIQQRIQLQLQQQQQQLVQQKQQVQSQQQQQQQQTPARMPTPTYQTMPGQQVITQAPTGVPQVVPAGQVEEGVLPNQTVGGVMDTQQTGQPQQVTAVQQQQQQQQQFQQLLVNAKTKTALANMLSIRLQSGATGEPTSAAGQLRLMTQQHQQQQQQQPLPQGATPQLQAAQTQQLISANAAGGNVVNVSNATPQQQQLLLAYQQQQRRTLGNISNNAGGAMPTQVVVRNSAGVVQGTYPANRVALAQQQQQQQQQQQAVVQATGAQAGATAAVPQGAEQTTPQPVPQPQPTTIQIQFYGHSPNIKVPGSLCLLGCVFYMGEYNMFSASELEGWKHEITSHGGEIEATYIPKVTHVLCPHYRTSLAQQAIREGKRLVSAFWLNDVVVRERMVPPWLAIHLPMACSEETRPLKKFIISSSGFNKDDKERIKFIVTTLGGRYTSYFTKENKILICRKTEGQKYQYARQWRTTIVNAHWLHEVMLGSFRALHATTYTKYQQFNLDNPLQLDYTIAPPLMIAWKVPVPISQETFERGKALQQQQLANPKRKRPGALSPTRVAVIAQEVAENRMDRPVKLLKPAEDSVIQNPEEIQDIIKPITIAFSLVTNKQEKKKQVLELGGTVTNSYDNLTYLVMGEAQRTVKLMCAVSVAKYIVTENWLTDSYAQKKFLDADKYIVNDSLMEKSHNFVFRDVLQKPNRTELFKEQTFYLSPGVVPSTKVMEDIIVCAGGRVDKQRRGAPHILELNRQKPGSYIVLADMNDLHLLVELINARIDIYAPEMIFSSIFIQKLDLDDRFKLVT